MKKPKKAPRDFNQLAKLIMDMSTDESPPVPEPESTKNPHAVSLFAFRQNGELHGWPITVNLLRKKGASI